LPRGKIDAIHIGSTAGRNKRCGFRLARYWRRNGETRCADSSLDAATRAGRAGQFLHCPIRPHDPGFQALFHSLPRHFVMDGVAASCPPLTRRGIPYWTFFVSFRRRSIPLPLPLV